MGKYHPHGDSAIYDTLVRLAQDFSLRYPLVDGQGNFGSIDDDPAGRHAVHRGAPGAGSRREMLRDIDADTVDFGPNYDESRAGAAGPAGALPEPARQRLRRASRSAWRPTSRRTTCARRSTRSSPSSTTPTIDVDGPDEAHQGPGLPDRRHDPRASAGSATPTRPAAAASRSARSAHIEPIERRQGGDHRHRAALQVKKGGDGGLIKKIADLVHEKKITEISDLRDESDRNGMRLVIELKRDAIPKVVLNKLYKHTPMQTTFGVNMVALVDGVPRTLAAARASSSTTSTTSARSSSAAPSTSCASARRAPTSSRAC